MENEQLQENLAKEPSLFLSVTPNTRFKCSTLPLKQVSAEVLQHW